MMILIILLVVLAVILIPFILFCIMVSKLMKLIAPQNRRMSPGGAWLMLIPLFSLVWQFLMVGHIADSIAAEYRRRGLQLTEDRPVYNIGLWSCILSFSGIIPVIGALGGLASIVLRIVYWVKLAAYKDELERSGPWENFAHLDGAYANNYQQPGYNPNFNTQQQWGGQQTAWQPGQQQNWPDPNQQQNWPNPNAPQQNWQDPNQQQNWQNPNAPQQNWQDPNAPQQTWNTPPQAGTPPQNPGTPPPPPGGGINLNK